MIRKGGIWMGIKMEIADKYGDSTVQFGEIINYTYEYESTDSLYAKGTKEKNLLRITGDISRCLETNPAALEHMRRWSSHTYTSSDDYIAVSLKYVVLDFTNVHGSEDEATEIQTSRSISFPAARVQSYNENINPYTGNGTFEVVFVQREDKLADIRFEPYAEEFIKLEQL